MLLQITKLEMEAEGEKKKRKISMQPYDSKS